MSFVKHGMHDTAIYDVWTSMKQRCLNKNSPSFKRYGGRGITVCEEWMDFERFLDDMGVQPKGLSLDRIDNDKGYCKENCRWATRREQMDNLSTNRKIEYAGKIQSIGAWANEYGLSHGVLWNRIMQLGWNIERALTQPIRILRKKGSVSHG